MSHTHLLFISGSRACRAVSCRLALCLGAIFSSTEPTAVEAMPLWKQYPPPSLKKKLVRQSRERPNSPVQALSRRVRFKIATSTWRVPRQHRPVLLLIPDSETAARQCPATSDLIYHSPTGSLSQEAMSSKLRVCSKIPTLFIIHCTVHQAHRTARRDFFLAALLARSTMLRGRGCTCYIRCVPSKNKVALRAPQPVNQYRDLAT